MSAGAATEASSGAASPVAGSGAEDSPMPFIFRKRDSVRRPSFFFSLGARRPVSYTHL